MVARTSNSRPQRETGQKFSFNRLDIAAVPDQKLSCQIVLPKVVAEVFPQRNSPGAAYGRDQTQRWECPLRLQRVAAMRLPQELPCGAGQADQPTRSLPVKVRPTHHCGPRAA